METKFRERGDHLKKKHEGEKLGGRGRFGAGLTATERERLLGSWAPTKRSCRDHKNATKHQCHEAGVRRGEGRTGEGIGGGAGCKCNGIHRGGMILMPRESLSSDWSS